MPSWTTSRMSANACCRLCNMLSVPAIAFALFINLCFYIYVHSEPAVFNLRTDTLKGPWRKKKRKLKKKIKKTLKWTEKELTSNEVLDRLEGGRVPPATALQSHAVTQREEKRSTGRFGFALPTSASSSSHLSRPLKWLSPYMQHPANTKHICQWKSECEVYILLMN